MAAGWQRYGEVAAGKRYGAAALSACGTAGNGAADGGGAARRRGRAFTAWRALAHQAIGYLEELYALLFAFVGRCHSPPPSWLAQWSRWR
ncbi:hypothetical protein ACP70R_049642 [Stipagrostis hirtigluma subsp. patula]